MLPTSNSGTSDPFPDGLEFPTLLCARAHIFGMPWLHLSPSSQHECCVTLLAGRFCDFGSGGPSILMDSCMLPATFVWIGAPCASVYMFRMPTWLLCSSWSFTGRLTGLTGKFHSFEVFLEHCTGKPLCVMMLTRTHTHEYGYI